MPGLRGSRKVPSKTGKKTGRGRTTARGSVEYINPSALHPPRGYTHAVAVSGNVRTIYIGAQMPMDASGALVGKGDVGAQTEQVLKNIEACLKGAGAEAGHVIQWNIYLVDPEGVQAGFEAGMRWWGGRPNPPANTVVLVSGFPLLPDVLVMMEAVAVVAG